MSRGEKSILFCVSLALCVYGAYTYLIAVRALLAPTWPIEYDSFYYLLELRRYAESGTGFFTRHLPFFYFFGKISAVLGWNELQTFRFIVVGSTLAFIGALFALAFDRKRPYAAFLIAYLAFSSKILFYAHYGFLKQAVGMGAFAAFLAFFVRARLGHRPWIRICCLAAALCFGVLAALFHKSTGFLVLIFSFFMLRPEFWSRFKSKSNWTKRAALAIGVFAVLFVFLCLQRRLDLKQFFTVMWPPDWYGYWIHHVISPREFGEYVSYPLCATVMAVALISLRGKWEEPHLALLIFWGLAFFFFTENAWRFGLTSAWIFFIALALFQRVPESDGLPPRDLVLKGYVVLFALGSLALSDKPRAVGPGMDVELIPRNREWLVKWIPPTATVVAPHGVEFRVTYFLGLDAVQDMPARTDGRPLYRITGGQKRTPTCIDNPGSFKGDWQTVDCAVLDSWWRILRIR